MDWQIIQPNGAPCLEPLINQVHETGRYHMLDYARFPGIPLTPEDQEWLRQCPAAGLVAGPELKATGNNRQD